MSTAEQTIDDLDMIAGWRFALDALSAVAPHSIAESPNAAAAARAVARVGAWLQDRAAGIPDVPEKAEPGPVSVVRRTDQQLAELRVLAVRSAEHHQAMTGRFCTHRARLLATADDHAETEQWIEDMVAYHMKAEIDAKAEVMKLDLLMMAPSSAETAAG